MTPAQATLIDDVIDFDRLDSPLVRQQILSNNTSFDWRPINLVEAPLSSLYSGLDTSPQRIQDDNTRRRLVATVKKMRDEAASWDGTTTSITINASIAAEMFLSRLPENRALPKVAADGEGDVMFVWEGALNSCIVIVEDRVLHLIDKPGSPDAHHIDASPFYGAHIPLEILRHLPMK